MKFIRFVLTDKSVWTFSEDEAKAILKDSRQLYPLKEKDGKWHGRTFNKAHIIHSDFDYEAEKRWREENEKKLEMPEISEEQRKKNIQTLARMKADLIKKKVITKTR